MRERANGAMTEHATPLQFGLLVFPKVQQLDLTGPYEVFATWPGAPGAARRQDPAIP